MKDFMKNFKEKITGFHYKKPLSFLDLPLFLILLIPSVFYSFIIIFKNILYTIGLLKEGKAKAKIICVGNLTTGGVGKTPIVIEFCKYLSKKGKKVSSLSRGYGGKLKGINIIKDFNNGILIDNANLTGDEVQLIAKNSTPEADYAVVTSSNRLKGANYAAKNLNVEIIIMDDGFSNRKIKKDLTLLLFDSKKFIGNGFLLPLGALREPLVEIKRADGIVLIDKESLDPAALQKTADYLNKKFKKPVYISKFGIDYFYNIKTGEKIENHTIKDVYGFSAIGSPKQFYNYLKPFNLLGEKSFNDHYLYTESDIQNITVEALKKGAKFIITTEKDAVKIKDFIHNYQNDKTPKSQPEIKILAMKLKAELDIESILKNSNI